MLELFCEESGIHFEERYMEFNKVIEYAKCSNKWFNRMVFMCIACVVLLHINA